MGGGMYFTFTSSEKKKDRQSDDQFEISPLENSPRFPLRGGYSHLIPFNYFPRSRPPHEFPRELVLPRSTIKALPDAWRQIVTAQGAMICNVRLVLSTAALPFSATA